MLRSPLRPPLRSPLYPATASRAVSSLTEMVRAIYAVSGRVGFMGDTQDLSTMYTTRSGSVPIGTPGNGTAQFVGRWEDKSQYVGPASVLGPELVTNGSGLISASGWSNISNSTLSAVNGALRITSVAAAYFHAGQSLTTEAGKQYRVTGRLVTDGTDTSINAYVGTTVGNSNLLINTLVSSSVVAATPIQINAYFVATSTTSYLSFIGGSTAAGAGMYFDIADISVREISTNPANLGPELVTNGGFDADTDWSKSTGVSIASGVLTADSTIGSVASASSGPVAVIGKFYQVTFTVTAVTNASGGVSAVYGGVQTPGYLTTGTFTSIVLATSTARASFAKRGAGAWAGSIDNISVRELTGHHALAPNDTTGRPQLSARVNLLTYTEDLSNAAWTATGLTSRSAAASTVTLPSGQITSLTRCTEDSGNTAHRAGSAAFTVGVGTVCTFSGVVRGGGTRLHGYLRMEDGASNFVWINLSTGALGTVSDGVTVNAVTSLGGDAWHISAVRTSTSASAQVLCGHAAADNAPVYVGGGTAWFEGGALDLRPTNIHAAGSVPAYQRVVDAETYDSNGFPFRFIPNGTGQAFQTSTITPGSDVVTVASGLRKLSDAALALLLEFGPGTGNGVFFVTAPRSAGANLNVASRGTSVTEATSVGFAAPTTRNVIGKGAIASDYLELFVNGASAAISTADQGTGDYTAQVLNIFGRNVVAAGSLWFGGQAFRQAVIFGPALTPAETATLEAWVNESTKAY